MGDSIFSSNKLPFAHSFRAWLSLGWQPFAIVGWTRLEYSEDPIDFHATCGKISLVQCHPHLPAYDYSEWNRKHGLFGISNQWINHLTYLASAN